MKSFEYFLKSSLEIKHLNGDIQKLPVQAYAVDKPCGDEEITLKSQFNMGHFHSCDYILVKEEGDRVLLIEDSNLKKGKKDLENKCLRFMRDDEQAKKKLFEKVMERIRDEQRLKAYASLLLLCLLTSKDKCAKKLIGGKKIHFWVIVTDGDASDILAFEEIGDRLKGFLGPFISDVRFVPLKEAEEKLSEYG